MHQSTQIGRMEPIDILPWIDRVRDPEFIVAFGERRLHEDAIDGWVSIQIHHHGFQCFHRDVRIEIDARRRDSQPFASANLGADVHLTRRIGTDDDDGEMWCSTFLGECVDSWHQALLDIGCDRSPVDDATVHGALV